MKSTAVFGMVGMALFVAASATFGADKTKSEEAFDRLAALKDKWSGEQEAVKVSLIYTLTANGSALMEEFRPEKGPVMITMFTRRRRSSNRHPLLLGEKSTADGHVRHHRRPEAVGIFTCSHHRIEIARRLAQYRSHCDPERQRSFDSRMDLSVQRQEWENRLPLYTRPAGNELTELRG